MCTLLHIETLAASLSCGTKHSPNCQANQQIMNGGVAGQEVCTLLHVATFGSIIACLLRHFRSSLASLPLLSQPLGNLPIGTWAPSSRPAQQGEEGSVPEVRPSQKALLAQWCGVLTDHMEPCAPAWEAPPKMKPLLPFMIQFVTISAPSSLQGVLAYSGLQ